MIILDDSFCFQKYSSLEIGFKHLSLIKINYSFFYNGFHNLHPGCRYSQDFWPPNNIVIINLLKTKSGPVAAITR